MSRYELSDALECRRCSKRFADPEEAKSFDLVQHVDNACGAVLNVCGQCVVKAQACAEPVACLCCGDAVRNVTHLQAHTFQMHLVNFIDGYVAAHRRDVTKKCSVCDRSVALFAQHVRASCGVVVDQCVDCAYDAEWANACSGCHRKLDGELLPVGDVAAAAADMGRRKRKLPIRFGVVPIKEEPDDSDDECSEESSDGQVEQPSRLSKKKKVSFAERDVVHSFQIEASIVPVEDVSAQKQDSGAKEQQVKAVIAMVDEVQRDREHFDALVWGPLPEVDKRVDFALRNLKHRMRSFARGSDRYESIKRRYRRFQSFYSAWRCLPDHLQTIDAHLTSSALLNPIIIANMMARS